jgi:hypothetical protein
MLVARFDGTPEEVRPATLELGSDSEDHLQLQSSVTWLTAFASQVNKWFEDMLIASQMAKVREVVKGEVTPLASLGDLTDAQVIQKASHCSRCLIPCITWRSLTTAGR